MPSTQWDVRAILPLSLSAFVVWLACGLTMAFGREALGLETALRTRCDCRSCLRRARLFPLLHAVPRELLARRRCLLHRVHHHPGRRARRPGVREELRDVWKHSRHVAAVPVDLRGDLSDGNLDRRAFRSAFGWSSWGGDQSAAVTAAPRHSSVRSRPQADEGATQRRPCRRPRRRAEPQ